VSAWEPPRKSSIEIDSLQGMINSALAGYGITELPNYSVVLNSELKMVLPEIYGEDIIIYYIFMNNRKNSKKISKLYEFLIKDKKIP
jgi:DNA-binding transcriptional LysR family regulator